jgi:transcriptional regulator with XRE-family HTH domain
VSTSVSARFGQLIAAERQRRNLSLTALSAMAGVSATVLGNLESGRQGCRLDTALLVASECGISLDDLKKPRDPCERCGDRPMNGWTCNLCGAAGAEPQQRGVSRDG